MRPNYFERNKEKGNRRSEKALGFMSHFSASSRRMKHVLAFSYAYASFLENLWESKGLRLVALYSNLTRDGNILRSAETENPKGKRNVSVCEQLAAVWCEIFEIAKKESDREREAAPLLLSKTHVLIEEPEIQSN